MPSMMDIVRGLVAKNPGIAGNPRNKELVDVLLSGDAKRGEEVANNLLESYGMSREEALQQARSSLSQRFGLPL